MHRSLSNSTGRRIACLVVLAYVVSCIVPSAAMALNGAASANCFEEIAEQVRVAATHVEVHVHSNGTVHHHVDKKSPDAAVGGTANGAGGTGVPSHSHDTDCCGLFGYSAVLPQLSGAVLEPTATSIEPPVRANFLVGDRPARIDRPPISPLPM